MSTVNLRQKLERARMEIEAAILVTRAASHALINVMATIDELQDELNREGKE